MRAFLVPDVRAFMSGLLTGDLFTGWQLRSAEITVLDRVEFDGRINPEYLTEQERQSRTVPYVLWEEIQSKIRFLIQGGRTPTSLKITLALDPSKVPNMPSDSVESLLLNISFGKSEIASDQPEQPQKAQLTLITGISMKTFTMDKTAERSWDERIPHFFHNKKLEILVP